MGPEVGGEVVKVAGGEAGGIEGTAVEAVEDVRYEDVGGDGGERGGAAVLVLVVCGGGG